MPFSKEKIKQIVLLMLLATVLVLVVMYSGKMVSSFGTFLSILCPFLIGGAIAFVLNLPMRTLENRLLVGWKGKAKRPVCMLLSFVFVLAIVIFVVLMVVPQLISAGQQFMQKIPIAFEKLDAWLTDLSEKYPELISDSSSLSEMEENWSSILDNVGTFLKSGLSSAASSVISISSNALNAVVSGFIALIFSFYILSQKEALGTQGRRVLMAYLPDRRAEAVLDVCARLYKNFSSFITGQCIEAVVLGTIFVIAMSILHPFSDAYRLMGVRTTANGKRIENWK